MKINASVLYWKRCICKRRPKLATVAKDGKGGAFVDCKCCGRRIEIKYEGENEIA